MPFRRLGHGLRAVSFREGTLGTPPSGHSKHTGRQMRLPALRPQACRDPRPSTSQGDSHPPTPLARGRRWAERPSRSSGSVPRQQEEPLASALPQVPANMDAPRGEAHPHRPLNRLYWPPRGPCKFCVPSRAHSLEVPVSTGCPGSMGRKAVRGCGMGGAEAPSGLHSAPEGKQPFISRGSGQQAWAPTPAGSSCAQRCPEGPPWL